MESGIQMSTDGNLITLSDPTLLDAEGYLNSSFLDENVLTKWSGTIRPIPLPEHLTPRCGAPLRSTPKDVLLNVPPHVIAHLQRTASQGGLQVISPRQTPFCKTMIRHLGGSRRLGDHVVGSIANPDEEWPTIDGDNLYSLLPDEPLPTLADETMMEPKTETIPLTKASKLLSDPILACLVKGRAVVDILRRDDINGDADGVLRLLAEAWGVPIDMLAELEAYTLGIEGSLKRHAIKVDEVYPMMYAPIHVRRCISMGCADVTVELLPLDTSLDWKRMRVFCEAVFALAASIEGYPLTGLRCYPPPGDQSARTDRDHVLAFLPAPASAWSHAPSTFSICPVRVDRERPVRSLPPEVLAALSRYVGSVRPVSYAMEAGHRYATRRSVATAVENPTAETISECYRVMVSSIYVGGARGKTAAATIRHLIYSTLESLPDGDRMRIARYIKHAKEVCQLHLSVSTVPDSVINRLATKYTVLGAKIRTAVAAEAARRGSSVEEWWGNVLSQSPASYQHFVEGSHGWARIALWLVFKSPTEKWDSLIKAINISALSRAAALNVHGMALPARKGSMERILAAARLTVKSVTSTFASYYCGVADVAMAVAEEADNMGKGRTADLLREGAYIWVLRARCFRGTNVDTSAHGVPSKSPQHFRVYANPVDLTIAPAPYRAFEAYMAHVDKSTMVSKEVKMLLREKKGPVVSQYFADLHRPIVTGKESVVTRYLLRPKELARDLEASWSMLVEDLKHVVRVYSEEAEAPIVQPNKKMTSSSFTPVEMTIQKSSTKSFFAILGTMDPDNVDWVEDVMDKLPQEVQDEIYEGEFENSYDLMAAVSNYEKEHVLDASVVIESVR